MTRYTSVLTVLFATVSLTIAAPSLSSVAPIKSPVHGVITLRGTGFGSYVHGTSKVLFAQQQNVEPIFEAGTPLAWRDDLIRVRVPVGDPVRGSIPKVPLIIWVTATSGSSNPLGFIVAFESAPNLSFMERTMIDANNRDVSSFLGRGPLGFPELNLARTKDAEVIDINGDGFPDLVDYNSNNLQNATHSVLRINRGDKTGFDAFLLEPNDANDTAPTRTVVPSGNFVQNTVTYDADLVDLNNDDLPEVIQGAADLSLDQLHRVRILRNNNGGMPGQFIEDSSSWVSSSLLSGCPDDEDKLDFDLDGFIDIAVAIRSAHLGCGTSSSVLVYRNSLASSFEPPLTLAAPTNGSTHDVFLLDADNDGLHDVFQVNEIEESRLFLQGVGPAFAPTAQVFSTDRKAGDAADLNGNGLLDFTLAGPSAAEVFLNDPASPGTFLPGLSLPDVPVGTIYDLEAGDVDLDGDIDIVGAVISIDANLAVQIWLNDGNGSFTSATAGGATTLLPGLGAFQRLSADLIDFDLDGDLDLYVTGADAQDIGAGPGVVPNQFFENRVHVDPVPPGGGGGGGGTCTDCRGCVCQEPQ